MYEIEFNEETTLGGLLESFANLNSVKVDCYVIIGDIKIFNDTPNLNEHVTKVYNNYRKTHPLIIKTPEPKEVPKNQQETKELSEQYKQFNKLMSERNKYYFLRQNPKFLFELGIVIKYTKENYRDRMLEHYVNAYSDESIKEDNICRDLTYYSNILLILENNATLIEKQQSIQNFLNFYSNDKDLNVKLELLVSKIRMYSINGEKIDELLNLDLLDSALRNSEEELNRTLGKSKFNSFKE